MNPKASATLEKARDDRRRSNFKKALSRLEEGVEKFPKVMPLYTEAIDVGMEAGESLKAIQLFKKSQRELPEDAFELWSFTVEKVGVYNDPIMGRFMLEQAIKQSDLSAAHSVLRNLTDHAAGELLERIRTKKQTVSVARGTRPAARDEDIAYALGEALLHLRLGHFLEAAEGFVRALDESPGVFKPLEPFLADLQKQHEDKGEASYALGCCYVAGGRPANGVENLFRAAKKAPSLAPRVIEKIESLGNHPDLSVDILQLKLAELYFAQGDLRHASNLLATILDRNNAMAGAVADVLKPALESVGEDLDIHFIFVEASFISGRREAALAQLRKIHLCREHKARLVDWLDSKSQSGRLSADIHLFYAETALSEGLFGKAIEIFKRMLSHGTQEEPAIKELLSKYQSAALVRDFYKDRFAASLAREKETTCEFERYDEIGFAKRDAEPFFPDQSGEHETPALDKARDTRDDRLELDETPLRATKTRSAADADRPRPDFDNCDFSLSMHAPTETPVAGEGGEDSDPSSVPPDDTDLFDYLKRDFSSGDRDLHETDRTIGAGAPMTPERPGADGVDESYFAEAKEPPKQESREPSYSPSMDKDGSTIDAAAGPEETVTIGEADPQIREGASQPQEAYPQGQTTDPQGQPVDPYAQTSDPLAPAADPPKDFDSLYRAFVDGTLDRGRILDVVERAFDEGRLSEMKRLLTFEPENLGEEIARKYQLARYYLATDQFMSALVALKTVQLGALSREERKTLLLRIADCYRGIHNHEAAQGVYLRILSENPGDTAVEVMARSNYSRYLETAAGVAPALEKLTDL